MLTKRSLITAVTLLMANALAIGTAYSQEAAKIRLGILPPSLGVGRMQVAIAKEFFKKQGLNVEVTTFRSGAELATAAVTGVVDIAQSGQTPAMNARERGVPVKVFFVETDSPYYYLLAKPDIKSLEDAAQKGASVAVSGLGTSDYSMARYMFRKAGVDPTKLKYVASGSNAQRVATVDAGRIDLAIAGIPEIYDSVRNNRTKVLTRVETYSKNLAIETLWATEAYLDKGANAVPRFLAALDEAAKWMATSPEETEKLLLAYIGYTYPQAQDDVRQALKEIRYPTVADHKTNQSQLLSGLSLIIEDSIADKSIKADTVEAGLKDLIDLRYVK